MFEQWQQPRSPAGGLDHARCATETRAASSTEYPSMPTDTMQSADQRNTI
jgi:hypothetical protein